MQTSQPMQSVRDRQTAYMRRYGALEIDRSSWLAHWQDIEKVVIPRSGRFRANDRNRSGRSNYNAIYDNTGTRSLRVLEAGMMAGATSPARPWFRLTTPDPDRADHYQVRKWLDDVVVRMQRVFAKSNVYRALHQAYGELGAFGTSVIMVLPDFQNVIHCYPVACGQYCLQQDHRGQITTIYRKLTKTVGELVSEFGLEACCQQTQQHYRDRNFETPVEIMHVIEPRPMDERDPSSPSSKDMPWRSCYFETAGDGSTMLREGGFKRFPVLAPRWQVMGEDVYGSTCPGMDALGDIRQLQQEQLMKGHGVAHKAKPALQVPTTLAGREGELDPGSSGSYYDPGTIIPFDQVSPNGGVRNAFEVKLELDHLLMDIQDVRVRIQRAFYEDLFLMLANAGTDTRMTATEISERHEEKLLMLGPVLERLHNELLAPLIDITFDRMVEAGMIPPPPQELVGLDLSVEFVSILAQAQRAIGSNSVDRFMGNVMQIAQVKPEVLDKVNFDKWVDRYSRMLGIDTELVVDDDTVAALREARGRAQAAAEQTKMLREQAGTVKDLAQAPTDGQNALAQLAGYSTPQLGGAP